jgi:hypothetical protein
MEGIIHSYFLFESDFEITFKKLEKYAFEGCVEKHTLPVLKGLSSCLKVHKYLHAGNRNLTNLNFTAQKEEGNMGKT